MALAARDCLREILAGYPCEGLPQLDEAVRGSGYWAGPERQGWSALQAGDVHGLRGTYGAGWVLALLTFHGNGYVRERALRALQEDHPDIAMGYSLLRANDWVEPIRGVASSWLRAQANAGNLQAVAANLPLVLRLSDVGRVDAGLRDSLVAPLLGPDGEAVLHETLESGTRACRRAVVRLLADQPIEVRKRFVAAAVDDRDLVVRLWAAQQLEELEATEPAQAEGLRRRLIESGPAALVLGGLYSALRQRDEVALRSLPGLLLHRSVSVRHAARYYLDREEPGSDHRAFYRSHLEDRAKDATAAAAGLGEVGKPEDLVALRECLSAKSPRVVRAALKSMHRLDEREAADDVQAGLKSPHKSVRSLAATLLGRQVPPTARPWLMESLRGSESPEGERALVAAVARLPPWLALESLLELAGTASAPVRAQALDALRAWVPNARVSYAAEPPDGQTGERVRAVWSRTREELAADVRSRVQTFLDELL